MLANAAIRIYLGHHCEICVLRRNAMTAGAWLLIIFSTVPWVVWVVIYYLRNRKEDRR